MAEVLSPEQQEVTQKAADNIRILSAAMVEQAKSGHPGGAMGAADFINILFTEFLEYDPDDPEWAFRDRFFLDPGHMSPMLYSVLTLQGTYTLDDVKHFRQWGSTTPGHPELDLQYRIENTSGPLGQGHTNAVGAAIAERFLADRFGEWTSHNIYAFISDGGIQEEIAQGAGRIAGFLGLSKLIMFYDSNDIQLSSATEEVTNEDTAAKYEAWGWNVLTIDGHDAGEIRNALREANEESDRPTLIIGKTLIGKGALKEDGEAFGPDSAIHGKPLSKAGVSFEKTIEALGGDPEDPFQIFPEVEELYAKANDRNRKRVAERRKEQQQWEEEQPALAQKLEQFLSDELPELDIEAVEQGENISTRVASGNVLAHLGDKIENLIVASADLSDSDKTNAFLEMTQPFKKGDFSGSFLQAGVSELTMAALANGMALHGGVVPVCATFFVFSDFMKPAVRLASLMELPIIYIWTHDSFRVGEDGPTHQPVEQEAQIRLLEQLQNHSGHNSLVALRPADAAETTVAWKMALENRNSPTALILSRQNIKDLPPSNGTSRLDEARQAEKGAYVVKDVEGQPDVLLVANGSEVATLFEGAERLEEEKGLKVKIVSAISEGLFRNQPADYQQEVIPSDVPVLGLTSGLPSTLSGLVGCNGKCIGLDHFGYSAPGPVLDEKFGFTGDNVYKKVIEYLGEQ